MVQEQREAARELLRRTVARVAADVAALKRDHAAAKAALQAGCCLLVCIGA